MLHSVLRRVQWSFGRRLKLQKKIIGFKSSIFSYCSDDCNFEEYSQIFRDCICTKTSLGRFTYLNQGTQTFMTNIGAFCSIGQNVKLGGFGQHPKNISTHPSFFSSKIDDRPSFHKIKNYSDYASISIGHDVWIGDRALILDGINIATGAVVGAGAVVTRDISPYEIVAGVPARHIGFRVPEEYIDQLLGTKWWEWNNKKLKQFGHLIGSNNFCEFVRAASKDD